MLLRRRLILFATLLVLSVCPLLAAHVTYTIDGKLGPVLEGGDPIGANGQSATLTLTANLALVPVKQTATSATYRLPVGALTAVINGTTFTSTEKSTMTIVLGAGADKLIVSTTFTEDGIPITLSATVSLAKNSFAASVLTHPAKFSPSPQTLTAATTAGGAGSQFSYTAEIIGTTVLGLSGSASD